MTLSDVKLGFSPLPTIHCVVANTVVCTHFGETLEIDQNVAVDCLPSGENISDCIWAFRSQFSKSGINDLLYISSNRINTSSISQRFNTDALLRSSYVLLAGRGSRDNGTLEEIDGLKSFIRELNEE